MASGLNKHSLVDAKTSVKTRTARLKTKAQCCVAAIRLAGCDWCGGGDVGDDETRMRIQWNHRLIAVLDGLGSQLVRDPFIPEPPGKLLQTHPVSK